MGQTVYVLQHETLFFLFFFFCNVNFGGKIFPYKAELILSGKPSNLQRTCIGHYILKQTRTIQNNMRCIIVDKSFESYF